MHRSPDLDQTTVKKKPEIVLFYNKTKVGVDCFDQMARLYTTRSATRRWPMSVWGNMLDIAAINAWILYKKSTRKQISRRKFIFCLVETLINRMANNSADSDLTQCRPNSTATRKRRHCHGANCKNMTVTLCQGRRNRPPNPPVGEGGGRGAQAWSGAPPIEYQPKTNIQVSTLSILIYCFMFRF